MARYDSNKLQRFKLSTEPSAGISICKTPRSLRSISSSNARDFTGRCFFYNQTADDDVLHQCQTLYMDFRVRKIAHELGHTKLRAKLSEDMVAVETVYHSNCLIKLYNRYRSHNNWKLSDRNKMMIQGKFMRKRHGSFPDIETN